MRRATRNPLLARLLAVPADCQAVACPALFEPTLPGLLSASDIRAYDRGNSKELLGALIMERAKDIAEQRPPISHQHPDRDIRWQTTQALRGPDGSRL